MAELRCPNCGQNNSDLLDVCQFCQTPLKPESVLQIGEKPTKKNTGELESILPDWLKDVRQQAKEAADQEAAKTAADRRSQNDEPPDLLAGLASQAGSAQEEEVPDWLASLNPAAGQKPSVSSTTDSGSDFFSPSGPQKAEPEPPDETPLEETPAPMTSMKEGLPAETEKDELSEWFAQASGQSEQTFESEGFQGEMGWGRSFAPASEPEEESAPKQEEDLSWLHDLEASARQTGDLQTAGKEADWRADSPAPTSASSPEDLSWLDRLGGIEEPSQTTPEQSAGPQDESGWLDEIGTPSVPGPVEAAPDQAVPARPFAAEDDLSWLNQLGGVPEPAQPPELSSGRDEKPSSEDLSWLNDLGKPAPSETTLPSAAQPDLGWLDEPGGRSEPLSAPPLMQADSETDQVPPRQTAPLHEDAAEEAEPDWLKRATEAPSMPAPGDLSMDWFSSSDQAGQEKTPPDVPQTAPSAQDIFSTHGEPESLSDQDIDSLFSVEMPDWLSQPEPGKADSASPKPAPAPGEADESLAPVDLPSWVQAMRPVEAVITETASGVADQPAETEGPLAGLQGVIPISPIGSSRRPKPVSLTLQTTDEQQAGALLLEQILGSETSPRTLIDASLVSSQHWLRWALAGLFLLVLSAATFLRSQSMPVPAGLPEEAGALSNAILSIPANSKVLVVVGYEPALAGEMEAIGGPLLDQIVLLSQPDLSFISTSPNGPALVERLLSNTNIRQTSVPYHNLGYLPGGSAGVLGFMESPVQVIPAAGVSAFSEFSAIVVLTDHAESGRLWVEQLQNRRQVDPVLTDRPLLVAASAQAGPLFRPYVSSRQVAGMISGLPDAARYEAVNSGRPGLARAYWDTFGIGLMLSVALIVAGALWSFLAGLRARRTDLEEG